MNRRRRIIIIVGVVGAVVFVVAGIMLRALLLTGSRNDEPPAYETMPDRNDDTKEGGTGTRPHETAEGKMGKKSPAAPPPSIVVEKNGVKRAACDATCAFEQRCFERNAAECRAKSCGVGDDADVRKANRSDICVGGVAGGADGNCGVAAFCPCEEACWKRGECVKDHDNDKACAATCTKLVTQDPVALYLENRCIIESACSDLALCGGVQK